MTVVCSIAFLVCPKKGTNFLSPGGDFIAFFRRATMRKLKIAITLLRKKIQGCSTPPNEPQSSHYGRRSMVSEPYLDYKKSYGLLKLCGCRDMMENSFCLISSKLSTIGPMFINNTYINMHIAHLLSQK